MSKVFVLDANKQALNPVYPGRARLLLKAGKAAVYRHYPFHDHSEAHGIQCSSRCASSWIQAAKPAASR